MSTFNITIRVPADMPSRLTGEVLAAEAEAGTVAVRCNSWGRSADGSVELGFVGRFRGPPGTLPPWDLG